MNRTNITTNTSNRTSAFEEPPDGTPLRWRIYYNDGVYLSSKDCTWEQAPSGKIVAVVHAQGDRPAECELGTPYYWHFGSWIARVWDVSLYLRQTGRVKFGRWAERKLFSDAWREAVITLHPDVMPEKVLTEDTLRGGVVFTNRAAKHGDSLNGWSLYYDDNTLCTSAQMAWNEAPTDGVLCATYHCGYSGAIFSAAVRRYTYYLWRGHELINTDDLDEVLREFPQCKRGLTAFEGKSYLHQASALAAALADDLEDLR